MGDDPDHEASSISLAAGKSDAGTRTDRFLAERIGTISRSRVKALIEEGFVTRDGEVLREPASPVRADAVFVVERPSPIAAKPRAEAIPFPILFEDDHLIVLDKPAGLVTHPAPGNEHGTLVNALLAHCGDTLPGIGGEKRPGIVHRLDKHTSGVMVVAKSEQALAALSADIAARRTERAYLALAWGLFGEPAGRWDAAIGRDARDRKRMAALRTGGKPALTHWQRIAAARAVTLLRCRLDTGRTHQIRVHAAHSGHPLVGDPTYLRRRPASTGVLGPDERDRLLDFPRQALHAAVLGFRHPTSGKLLRFASAPPADLSALLDTVGLLDAATQHCA